MAKKMLTTLDMSGLEIQKFLVHNTTESYAVKNTGSLFYDTTNRQFKGCYNSSTSGTSLKWTTIMDTDHYAAIPTSGLSNNGFLKKDGDNWVIDITSYATNSSLSSHAADNTLHVSSSEKTSWNNAATNLQNNYYDKTQSGNLFEKLPIIATAVDGVTIASSSLGETASSDFFFDTTANKLLLTKQIQPVGTITYYSSWSDASGKEPSASILKNGRRVIVDSKIYEYANDSWVRIDSDDIRTMFGTDTSDAIDTWNEILEFVNGYKDSDDLAAVISKKLTYSNVKINGSALASDNLSFYAPKNAPASTSSSNVSSTVNHGGITNQVSRRRVISNNGGAPTWSVDKQIATVTFTANNTLNEISFSNLTGSDEVIVRVYMNNDSMWEEIITDVKLSSSTIKIGFGNADSIKSKSLKIIILV